MGGAASPLFKEGVLPVSVGGRPAHSGGYRVLARVYRPTCFGHLVGQPFLVRVLRRAFESGRIHHAFLLSGSHGVGKTTVARLLARSLNFEPEPSFDLDEEVWGAHCQAILNSRHVDVVEIDAASHTGVDDIRSILESISYAPTLARYRVFIIDEAHMLSRSAFNALLKVLEEPPSHVKFIFATTEVSKIPLTILSRCQRFRLSPISLPDLEALCSRVLNQEGYACEPEALSTLAFHAQGSARDALSILDQVIIAAGVGADDKAERPVITREHIQETLGLLDATAAVDILACVAEAKGGEAICRAQEQYKLGVRPEAIVREFLELIHGLFVSRVNPEHAKLLELRWGQTPRQVAFLGELRAGLNAAQLSHMWQILSDGFESVRASPRPSLACDMLILRLVYALRLPPLEELLSVGRAGQSSLKAIKEDPLVASLFRGFPQAKIERCTPVSS